MDISDFDLTALDISDNFIANRDYVFFDKDFLDLVERLRSAFEVLNVVMKRWRRYDEVAISKSVFDYESSVTNMARHCDKFYCFKYGDFEISVRLIHHKFCVYVDFDSQERFDMYFSVLNASLALESVDNRYTFRSPFRDVVRDACSDYLTLVSAFVGYYSPNSKGVLF